MLPRAAAFRVAGAALLLVLLAILASPGQRPAASPRPGPGGHRGDIASPTSPAPESPDLSVSAWTEREDAVVLSRSEYDEDEDEVCGEALPACDTRSPSLSASRLAPARDLTASGPPSAPRPMRC
ncbi:hypothetical protein OJF2_02320 [Aquisphaera giovannonii]|uniref:Uncharacterized protein n=1 Tax=Aquisphaera giovannonii TaxID=406548 RepID=A0A5B9VV38_9BACT|nr:hypothetical protein [Aquisphaera giovannonii]QEH31767.1 hypothetical protein OJF2_02320 [Aquisphaera giovannonii]